MTGQARRRMSGPQRRDAILDVCRAIALSEGFGEVTLERVARECGITRTMLYKHFGNLAGMVLALVEREVERAGATAALGETGTPTELLDRLVAVVDREPAAWRIVVFPPAGAPAEVFERLEGARDDLRTAMRQAWGPGSGPDADLVGRLSYAATEELIRLHLTDPVTFTAERLRAVASRLPLD